MYVVIFSELTCIHVFEIFKKLMCQESRILAEENKWPNADGHELLRISRLLITIIWIVFLAQMFVHRL